MSITTSAQITKWFELYRTINVTFTKEVIKGTGLDPRGVFLKCVGEQWPCVVYSSSFLGAKILASSKSVLSERIAKANNLISLRLSFKFPDKVDPVSFFIAAKAVGFAPYAQAGAELQYITIHYTQRPPDDFIDIVGRLLEANINSSRRRAERILLTPDAMRRINLASKETYLFIQGIPRKCILRDLSFSGSKAIIIGVAKFLIGKVCTLRIEMEEPREFLDIQGMIVRDEEVEGRKDLTAIAIDFDPALVPMTFKMHINDYLSQFRQPRSEGESLPKHAAKKDMPPRASKEAVPAKADIAEDTVPVFEDEPPV
jgi:hypothetical protein